MGQGNFVFMSSPLIVSVVLPLATVLVIMGGKIIIKLIALESKKGKINYNDFNIGFDIAYTAMLIFIAEIFNNSKKLVGTEIISNIIAFLIIFILFNFLLVISIGLWGTDKKTGEIGPKSVFSLIIFGAFSMLWVYLLIKGFYVTDGVQSPKVGVIW
ncbi:hypothetical protein [Priestia megaterium]|uniref:hypothetical protein n=1 Tax=Priestia megaterium TaxID=1404 RepID=UPI00317E8B05